MNKNPYWLKAFRGICLLRRTEILETGISMCFIDLLIIFYKSEEGYGMGACIWKCVVYDMSCKIFHFFCKRGSPSLWCIRLVLFHNILWFLLPKIIQEV